MTIGGRILNESRVLHQSHKVTHMSHRAQEKIGFNWKQNNFVPHQVLLAL